MNIYTYIYKYKSISISIQLFIPHHMDLCQREEGEECADSSVETQWLAEQRPNRGLRKAVWPRNFFQRPKCLWRTFSLFVCFWPNDLHRTEIRKKNKKQKNNGVNVCVDDDEMLHRSVQTVMMMLLL